MTRAKPTVPISNRLSRPEHRGSPSTRTARATSTTTTRPTTRSTRSTRHSCARTSPPGRQCSRCFQAELSRSRNQPSGVEPSKKEEIMRTLIAVPALLVLGACNVSKEGNAVTVQYDQNTAENTAADIGNFAENTATDIGNDVKNTGEKIQNKVGNTDVDIKVGKDEKTDNKAENKTEKK